MKTKKVEKAKRPAKKVDAEKKSATKIDLLDVLGVLKSLPDVLVESEASRSRRNATSRRLIAPPPPGTPLLVSLALALEHTGIYLGKNRVAELRDDGSVAVVSLTDFVNGDPCDVSLRTGTLESWKKECAQMEA